MRGSLVERQSELLLRSDVPGPGVRGRPFFPGLYAEQIFGAGFGLEGAEPDGGRGALAAGVVGTSKLPRCNTLLSVDISQVKS